MAESTHATKEAPKVMSGLTRRMAIGDQEYGDTERNDLTKMYEGTLGKISEGEIVRGRIVHIGDTEVTVDIGFKSEGNVPLAEFMRLTRIPIQFVWGDNI